MAAVTPDSKHTHALLDEVGRGDRQALDRLLTHSRPNLHEFVEYHFDPRLRSRLDPSDVVQEVQVEVMRRMDDYLRRRPMPFHLWLRKTAYERLLNLRRDHLRACRSLDREVPLPERSSLLMARPLLHGSASPSQKAEDREFAQRVGDAIAELSDRDREILTMRHAEERSYEEIGYLLEIDSAAARKRYGRALIRLQSVLSAHGLMEDRS